MQPIGGSQPARSRPWRGERVGSFAHQHDQRVGNATYCTVGKCCLFCHVASRFKVSIESSPRRTPPTLASLETRIGTVMSMLGADAAIGRAMGVKDDLEVPGAHLERMEALERRIKDGALAIGSSAGAAKVAQRNDFLAYGRERAAAHAAGEPSPPDGAHAYAPSSPSEEVTRFGEESSVTTDSLHPMVWAGGPALLLVFVVILIYLFRKTFGGGGGSGRSRAHLPAFAFDVEGGSADHGGGKALHPSIAQAAAAQDVAMLRDWIADERCTLDAKLAATGATALHAGARAGHANIVRMLLDAGADALCVDNELQTPLHLVAEGGHGLCVKALLDAGADPEGRDKNGRTPLAIAETERHMGTARMMRLHLERRNMSAIADGGPLRRAR